MLEPLKALNTYMVKISMDTTIDNQQVREVAYFAGLMDGEGSFCLEKSQTKNGKIRFTPRFSFGITSQLLAQKFQVFLQKQGIPYYLFIKDYPAPYNKVYSFEIKRMLPCLKFCQLLQSNLIEKQANCNGLIRFIQSRCDDTGNLIYRGQSKHGYAYEPWVHDLWLEMRIRNGGNKPKGNSSQLANLNEHTSHCVVTRKALTEDVLSSSVERGSTQLGSEQ